MYSKRTYIVYIIVYIYTYIHIYIYTYIHIKYLYMCTVYIYIFTHIYVCIYIYVYVHITHTYKGREREREKMQILQLNAKGHKCSQYLLFFDSPCYRLLCIKCKEMCCKMCKITERQIISTYVCGMKRRCTSEWPLCLKSKRDLRRPLLCEPCCLANHPLHGT